VDRQTYRQTDRNGKARWRAIEVKWKCLLRLHSTPAVQGPSNYFALCHISPSSDSFDDADNTVFWYHRILRQQESSDILILFTMIASAEISDESQRLNYDTIAIERALYIAEDMSAVKISVISNIPNLGKFSNTYNIAVTIRFRPMF